MRIAVLNSHPIQYFAPLYAYLNASDDFEVTALYCTDFSLRGGIDAGFQRAVRWDIDLLAGYNAVFLGERAKVRVPGGFFSLVAPEVWSEVRSGKYDILILHGHNFVANFIALVAAKTKRIPVMMRCETHLGLDRHIIKQLLRRMVLSAFYRFIDRFLAIGTANRQFYLRMGVQGHQISLMPYSVDNERFMASSTGSPQEREDVRRALGAPIEKPIVLFASKLSRRKRPDDLVRAAAALRRQGVDFSLVFVGTGEMEKSLRALVVELGLDQVVFAGFVNQRDLPRVFWACDVFVLPSVDEPWGLVVNEAMCAGLPIVISSEVGCVADLVKNGGNGFLYEAASVRGLEVALGRILRDPDLRVQMGRTSLKVISAWGYAQCLSGLRAAMRGLCRVPSAGVCSD